ncbi:hypothetical protein Scep_024333 [Stephania cephalantha]|uniref:Uncharacterized protein n=1 Tax=Stephania cephalantha TaxID=152367 RepID=A0AAP0HTK8_9MAGN
MLSGLQELQEKMSKSDPSSSIFTKDEESRSFRAETGMTISVPEIKIVVLLTHICHRVVCAMYQFGEVSVGRWYQIQTLASLLEPNNSYACKPFKNEFFFFENIYNDLSILIHFVEANLARPWLLHHDTLIKRCSSKGIPMIAY